MLERCDELFTVCPSPGILQRPPHHRSSFSGACQEFSRYISEISRISICSLVRLGQVARSTSHLSAALLCAGLGICWKTSNSWEAILRIPPSLRVGSERTANLWHIRRYPGWHISRQSLLPEMKQRGVRKEKQPRTRQPQSIQLALCQNACRNGLHIQDERA